LSAGSGEIDGETLHANAAFQRSAVKCAVESDIREGWADGNVNDEIEFVGAEIAVENRRGAAFAGERFR